MEFLIQGADQKTGRDLTFIVNARDPAEAERIAIYNDILISSIARPTARLLDYRTAEPAGQQNSPSPSQLEVLKPLLVIPAYQEILAGARWLRYFARAAGATACLAIVASVVCSIVGTAQTPDKHADPRASWFIAAASLLAIAGASLFSAVVLRTCSGLALALRDLARNSFCAGGPEGG
jgi:hypothetical protein